MRSIYRRLCKREEFQPGWLGIFFNSVFLFRRELHRAMARHSSTLQGVVVDFGCGRKPYRNLVRADRYIGLDLPVSGHPTEAKAADVFFDGRRIPLGDATADCVIASEVFEHVFDLPETLSEIYRILKPGGRLLVTCPFCWNEHEIPFDFARYTRFGLAHMTVNAGFRLLVQEKIGSFLPALFQMMQVYLHGHLKPQNGPISAGLGIFYNTLFNSLGIIVDKVMPIAWDFYLGNVLVAEKESRPLSPTGRANAPD